MKMKISAIFVFLTVMTSCGIKGPPLPPLQEETVQKQSASETISADSSKAQTIEKK